MIYLKLLIVHEKHERHETCRGRRKFETVYYQIQDAVFNVYLECPGKKCAGCCLFVIFVSFVDITFFHYVRNISYIVSRKRFLSLARIRVCLS